MLNFIGIGSAFNTELANTSAFVKNNNSLLLIDCGGTVFHRLQELNMFDGLENLYIIITHTHPDHVGSLGEVIFYSYYILNHIPTIFFPNKEILEGFLTSIGVSAEMYKLNSSEIIDVNDTQLGKFRIEFLPVPHVDTIPAYGFIMKLKEKSFYYSGDANNISLKKLCSIVQPEFRNKVYCMHLDKHITNEEISDKGFNVVEVYK